MGQKNYIWPFSHLREIDNKLAKASMEIIIYEGYFNKDSWSTAIKWRNESNGLKFNFFAPNWSKKLNVISHKIWVLIFILTAEISRVPIIGLYNDCHSISSCFFMVFPEIRYRIIPGNAVTNSSTLFEHIRPFYSKIYSRLQVLIHGKKKNSSLGLSMLTISGILKVALFFLSDLYRIVK